MSKYVIVDLEMCNVPKRIKKENNMCANEVIEIGAVLLSDDYEIVDRFKTYVAPQYGVLSAYIQKLTGISESDVKNAPTFQAALESFARWLPEDAILVSWSDNDERQIRAELEAKCLDVPGFECYLDSWEDCQKTFSEKMDSQKVYRLSEALIITDIDFDENIHDGLVDAENTAMLFAKMMTESELKLISCYSTEEDDSAMFTPIAGLLKNFTFVL